MSSQRRSLPVTAISTERTPLLALTGIAPAFGSGIATQPVLLDVGSTLAPFGWGICAFVAVVLMALLAAIAVEAWRTRRGVATSQPLAAGRIHPPPPWIAAAESPWRVTDWPSVSDAGGS